MGQLWSAISEYRKMMAREAALEKDDFYPRLRELVEKLPSFQKIENYCTTTYCTSYASIKLADTDHKELDTELIKDFLKENLRENWVITVNDVQVN